jgi:tetratricopeptide (TPR) repeat protein
MSQQSQQPTLLDRFYQDFLRSERSADFVDRVSRFYSLETLSELVAKGSRTTRRAAALAVGFLGDYSAIESLGRALHDKDRAVRMLADHGLRQLWYRQGIEHETLIARRLARLNMRGQHEQALDLARQALTENDSLAEVWHQRASAHYALGEYDSAISAFEETLFLNRYHFLAAVGLANCHLQQDSVTAALEAFRLALQINPDLESVRSQILHLEKILDD